LDSPNSKWNDAADAADVSAVQNERSTCNELLSKNTRKSVRVRPHVDMIDGAGALVDPRGPVGGDVIRLEAVGKTQGEIDVRPRIFAISRPDPTTAAAVIRWSARAAAIRRLRRASRSRMLQASYGRRCGG
jgi:hypothetical protein